MLVDLELEFEFEVLEQFLRHQDPTAFRIAVLTTDNHAVLHAPFGGPDRFPVVQRFSVKEINRSRNSRKRGNEQEGGCGDYMVHSEPSHTAASAPANFR